MVSKAGLRGESYICSRTMASQKIITKASRLAVGRFYREGGGGGGSGEGGGVSEDGGGSGVPTGGVGDGVAEPCVRFQPVGIWLSLLSSGSWLQKEC